MEWHSSSRDTTKFLHIKERAEAVRHLYDVTGVALPAASSLSRFITKSIRLVETAKSGISGSVPFDVEEWSANLNNVGVSTVWSIPCSAPTKAALVEQFRMLLMNAVPATNVST